MLKYNDLLTKEAHEFIVQDTETLVANVPAITQRLINLATDIAARADVLRKGNAFTNIKKRVLAKKVSMKKKKRYH
jgi:hypothetical protein